MNKQRTVVVLGGQNDALGQLSQSSIERLGVCVALYKKGDKILCTGGWGKHFNTLQTPHAFLAKEYLLRQGIPEVAFLPFALSANTVEDAVKAKEILEESATSKITVITSDFHMERVQLIFHEILAGFELQFCEAQSKLSPDVLTELICHEKKSIQKIKKNGLYY